MRNDNAAPTLTESWFADILKGATSAVQEAAAEQAEKLAEDAAKQLGAIRKALIKEGFSASEAFEIVRMTLQQGHEQNLADA